MPARQPAAAECGLAQAQPSTHTPSLPPVLTESLSSTHSAYTEPRIGTRTDTHTDTHIPVEQEKGDRAQRGLTWAGGDSSLARRSPSRPGAAAPLPHRSSSLRRGPRRGTERQGYTRIPTAAAISSILLSPPPAPTAYRPKPRPGRSLGNVVWEAAPWAVGFFHFVLDGGEGQSREAHLCIF